MTFNLRLGIIIVGLIIIYITLLILKKGRIPVKYSLIWLLSGLIILLLGIIPKIFISISKILGFATMANMISGVFIVILLMITIALTVIAAGQKTKTTLLIQEISILKEKLKEKN